MCTLNTGNAEYTYETANAIKIREKYLHVMMDNAPLFTRLRLLMLAILIEILTEIPLQATYHATVKHTQYTKIST